MPSGGAAETGQFGDFLDVRDRSARTRRLGEQVKRHILVVAERRERLIQKAREAWPGRQS